MVRRMRMVLLAADLSLFIPGLVMYPILDSSTLHSSVVTAAQDGIQLDSQPAMATTAINCVIDN